VALKRVKPGIRLSKKRVRDALSSSEGHDPTYTMAQEFVGVCGVRLYYDYTLQKSPAGLFRRKDGVYLVQLRITPFDCEADNHSVCYDANTGELLDNEPRGKVPIVEESDKTSNKQAIKVFRQLFPNSKKIELIAVSEAIRVG
jgi:hypothetical protein